MADLYIVIYMFGAVGGTVGPLPYDKAECLARASDLNTEVATKWKPGVLLRGREVGREDIVFICEQHSKRPQNEERSND